MHGQIAEAFQPLSVILVFVVMFFSLKYPDIIEMLEKKDVPKGRNSEMADMYKDIERTKWVSLGPSVFLSFSMSYVMLPTALRLLASAQFSPWALDMVLSSFMLLFVAVASLAFWCAHLWCQLCRKAKPYRAAYRAERSAREVAS